MGPIGLNADPKRQLATLHEMARDRAADARQVIVENIADMFLSPRGRLTEREAALMLEILFNLVHHVEMLIRRGLAQRFAELTEAPHGLVVALANGDMEAARPILMQTDVLRDVELIARVKDRAQEHMLYVQRRDAMSETVADTLVEGSQDDAVEALISTDDAELGRRALAHLIERSQRLDRFRRPVLMPVDLSAALAHQMFWWVSAALRQYILRHFGSVALVVDDHLRDATQTSLDQTRAEMRNGSAAAMLAKSLADRGALSNDFMIRVLREGDVQLFIAALAQRGRLSAGGASRILFDDGGEPLALVCKAIGMPQGDFATIYRMSRLTPIEGQRPEMPNRLLHLFESIRQSDALTALRYWQDDDGYLQAQSEIAHALTETAA